MDTVLQRLTGCHSTPGDEGEVRDVLEACWQASGWKSQRLGDYALLARNGRTESRRPELLICAHMDSPGFSIDRLQMPSSAHTKKTRFGVVELGSPACRSARVPAVLKTRGGKVSGTLVQTGDKRGEHDWTFEPDSEVTAETGVRQGDRVCFAPRVPEVSGDELNAPFLDNRLGCWMLTRLADEVRGWETPFEIVLAATASEEMCGFGARVLAAHADPARTVVLDTTYESDEQNVRLGKGPVLTLSDTAVLVSPALRDRVLEWMAADGVPLQTEVYNFSGTDARAFPQAGRICPVLPVLIPTRGNHSPAETADLRDLDAWLKAIRTIAAHQ